MQKQEKVKTWNVRMLRVILLCSTIVVLVLYFGCLCYPVYKIYLPWNKLKAIKKAEEYYYTAFNNKIKYSHMEVFIPGDAFPYSFYRVYFTLNDEQACVFSIDVEYDIDTECQIATNDRYLVMAMKGRMKTEIEKDIEKAYGGDVEMIFAFDEKLIVSEDFSLANLKEGTQCQVVIFLKNRELTMYNKKEETEKLYEVYCSLQTKGYTLKKIYYEGKKYIYKKEYAVEIPELKSLEETNQILTQVLNLQK